MSTKKRTARWWKLLFSIWLILFVLGTIGYMTGAKSLRAKTGASITIDRSVDYNLLKINDSAAFYYSPKRNSVSLVTYEPAFVLFKIFGDYSYGHELIPEPLLLKNGWVYSNNFQYFDKGRLIAYNMQSGTSVIKKTPLNDASMPEEYIANNLTVDNNNGLKVEDLVQAYPRLSVPKESAIIFFSGFLIVGLLLLLIWPFARKKMTG